MCGQHYRRPFYYMRRTWWDGVKEDVWRGRVKGELAKRGSSERMAVKPACVCVSVFLLLIRMMTIVRDHVFYVF